MYNIEERCSGKAVSNTYYECACAALGIQHAMSMHRTAMWPVRFFNIFLHYLIDVTIFEKQLLI
jgi:hypothetical protein